ncbi:MAG: hypothetical protein RR330_01155 [Alistipes sp.]
MKKHLLILLFTAFIGSLYAQRPTVTARLEPDSIGIGDQFTYAIEVDRDLVQVVEFPTFAAQDKESGLELVTDFPVDTIEHIGRHLKLRKRYLMAAFEEGLIHMGHGRVLYADKNTIDTLYTADSLTLQVGTFQIDSTSQSIYDIKAQKTMPFRFGEISGYIKWGLLALLLLGSIAYAIKRILGHYGKRVSDLFKPTPPLPPHVVALQALEALHHQKLWQNEKYKLYYSGLTDILRTYMAGRWGERAMEMTSDEIIDALRRLEIPKKNALEIATLLQNADLVKFAKGIPEAEQSENDYQKVYAFVEQTKEVEELPEEMEAEKLIHTETKK